MIDDESKLSSLDLIAEATNKLAREIGAMDLDDPRRASLLKELLDLTQIGLQRLQKAVLDLRHLWTGEKSLKNPSGASY